MHTVHFTCNLVWWQQRLNTKKLWILTRALAIKQWTLCDFSYFATTEQCSTVWRWLVVGVVCPSSSMWTIMLWKLLIGLHRLWPRWSHGSQPAFHSCTLSAQGHQNIVLIWNQCECVGVKETLVFKFQITSKTSELQVKLKLLKKLNEKLKSKWFLGENS